MEAYEKVAKILRTDKHGMLKIHDCMQEYAGHNQVFDRVEIENQAIIADRLKKLRVKNYEPKSIYDALIRKLKKDDAELGKFVHKTKESGSAGFKNLLNIASELADMPPGMFLKEETAGALLKKNPPRNILSFLGHASVDAMLKNENIFEVFAALRFVEGSAWLNDVFFKEYEHLTPADFEERPIKAIVLGDQWIKAAERFVKKKYHNVSHLKELGFIFVIPVFLNVPGETMRTFTLVLHYFHEVSFYASLFKRYAGFTSKNGGKYRGKTFAEHVISLLRGDVIEERPSEKEFGSKWLIVQRYLAKEDEYDWRLFYPHVNPEAVHWTKAEADVARISKRYDSLGFEFWQDLDFIGDFYPDPVGIPILVSFNLIDTVMSLVKEKQLSKYLYHHQEALWNKIFMQFAGEAGMEKMIVENFDLGVIDLCVEKNKKS
ncbi:MAG: hypothetical protein Q7S66_05125 [bacterium]|nr:hypothetical protein [bacterium]